MSARCDLPPLYKYTEIYIVNIPPLLFFLTGAINFYKIRSIGFNRVVKFSQMFLIKKYTVMSLFLLNLVKIVASIIDPDWWIDHSSLINCGLYEWMFNIMKAMSALGWIFCYQLMIYQYRKGLSEVWYSHTLFFFLNFMASGFALGYGSATGEYTTFQIVFTAIEVVLSVVLIVLIFNTKRRTSEMPRGVDGALLISTNNELDLDLEAFRMSSAQGKESLIEAF